MKKQIKIDLSEGPCEEVLKDVPDNHFDAVITDPPYGLGQEPDPIELLRSWIHEDDVKTGSGGFMGRSWDATVPPPSTFKEILRVTKVGKKSAFFAGTRTLHLMVASLKMAGWHVSDVWAWCYGCFDEETEVFVNGEWVGYESLEAGQKIRSFTRDGRFIDAPIQEVVTLPDYDDIAYQITGPGVDQLVSHNHRVVIWDEETNTYKHKVVDALCGADYVEVPGVTKAGAGLHNVEVMIRHIPSYQKPMWCVRVPTGMVVIRRNGKVSISGNSGFPKSLNINKALKKKVKARYEDDRCSCVGADYVYDDSLYDEEGSLDTEKELPRKLVLDDYGDNDLVTRVCSWCAKPDQGFIESTSGLGTAMKPSWEPCIIVKKPSSEIKIEYESLLQQYGFSKEEIHYIMTAPNAE